MSAARGRMPVGPMRDVLALLQGATRGGEWLTVHRASDRTGVPYPVMGRRLWGLAQEGYAEVRWVGGAPEYRAADLAREALAHGTG